MWVLWNSWCQTGYVLLLLLNHHLNKKGQPVADCPLIQYAFIILYQAFSLVVINRNNVRNTRIGYRVIRTRCLIGTDIESGAQTEGGIAVYISRVW